MYDKFKELPEAKQTQIINAALEVFSKNDYKRSSTDDIAAKAGISKGSLFYYFQNKKSLYLFLYQYVIDILTESLVDQTYLSITDFFELMEYCVRKKAEMMEKAPYLFDFSMRSFYSADPVITTDLNLHNSNFQSKIFEEYFKGIDFSMFREEADPNYFMQMLLWLSDGYLHQQQIHNQPITVAETMKEFQQWMRMLKPLVYKEEFL